jgi:hypothetical protein
MRLHRISIQAAVILAFVSAAALATTWHVPEDMLTIQAALNSLSDGDSIIVDPGLYIESLQAPNHLSFVMIGIFDTTKENDDWPIVDPSWLDSSNRKACFTIPSNTTAIIKNIWFRNSWPMFPRLNGSVGGFLNYSPDLTVYNCRFDSTYRALSSNNGVLTVEDCEFRNSLATTISKNNSNGMTIRHSQFSGGIYMPLFLYGNVLVDSCSFTCATTEWIWVQGSGVTIRGCTFTQAFGQIHALIWTINASDLIIEDNTFANFSMMNDGTTLSLGSSSSGTVEICGNLFSNLTGGFVGARAIDAENGAAHYVICGNVFDNCVGGSARGILVWQRDAVIVNNTFLGFSNGVPYVKVRRTLNDTIRINNQSFAGTGWALAVDGPNFVNAENNWWGDSTGPYHVLFNPNGQGATITGAADFDPWMPAWGDSDSTDTATELPTPLPTTIQLAVYPNPFNAAATLDLTVNEPEVYDVELFNTLGQRALHVWSGHIVRDKQISLDARALPSGVYFVRVINRGASHTVALSKIMLLK